MDFRKLEYFIISAQTGSFSKAAEHLYISQSAITQQIHAMEKEIGCSLFVRTSKGIALTSEGAALLPAAKAIRETWNKEMRKIQTPVCKPTLRIGYFGLMENDLLSRIAEATRSSLKLLRVKYIRLRPDQVLEAFKQNDIDLLFSDKREAWIEQGLHFTPLFTDHHYIILSKKNPLSSLSSLSLEKLRGLPLLMPAKRPLVDHFQNMASLPGIDILQHAMPEHDMLNVVADILSSDAVTIMPGFLCPASAYVVSIPLEPDVPFPVGIFSGETKNADVSAFIHLAHQVLQKSE